MKCRKLSVTGTGTHLLAGLFLGGFLLFSINGSKAIAADSVIALGKVRSDGVLTKSENTVSGTVSVSSGSVGSYSITIDAPGAFAGMTEDHVAAFVTLQSEFINDEAPKAKVTSIGSGQIIVTVRIDDIEDSDNLSGPEPADQDFDFAIYRIPPTGPFEGRSQFVLASGFAGIQPGDFVDSQTGGIGRLVSEWSKVEDGNWQLTLSNPGFFAHDDSSDYILLLTLGSSLPSEANVICGKVHSTSSDDEVIFTIRTNDAEDATDPDTAVPVNSSIYFQVLYLPDLIAGSPPISDNDRVFGLLKISGTTGAIRNGGSSIPGTVFSSEKIEPGKYRITFSFGRRGWVRRPDLSLGALVTLDQSSSSDEIVRASWSDFIGESGTPSYVPGLATLEITIRDAENSGSFGEVPVDADFQVLIPHILTLMRPDLAWGKTRTRINRGRETLTRGSGFPRVSLSLRGRRSKGFFFSMKNIGVVPGSYLLRHRRDRRTRLLKEKFYLLTGGRRNVTSAFVSGRHHIDDLFMGHGRTYQAKIRYRTRRPRPASFWINANEKISDPYGDSILVKTKPR